MSITASGAGRLSSAILAAASSDVMCTAATSDRIWPMLASVAAVSAGPSAARLAPAGWRAAAPRSAASRSACACNSSLARSSAR